MSAHVERFPRRIFRKIAVEPSANGWRCRIVGFDPHFRCPIEPSREFASREMALRVARAKSGACGLPVVSIETLETGTGEAA